FSSRRRHTRFSRDWSSDVCSSDLLVAEVDPDAVTFDQIERLPDGEPNIVRCPDPAVAGQMVDLIQALRKDQDSIGGTAEIVARNVPAGLGEPVFDKLKADLAKALFS